MSWTRFLFSFKGRFNRARYWLFILLYTLSLVVLLALGGSVIFATTAGAGVGGMAVSSALFVIVLILFILFAVVASIAVSVKRLHDRNKSGWWLMVFFFAPALLSGIAEATNPSPVEMSGTGLLVGLFSLVIAIWAFVELGVLRGTIGDNKYGPDPVASPAETAATFD
jgi:uncharacterized membrane protein YhaH (DUF805 family)